MWRDRDYRVICDRSGFKVWASDTKLQWDNLRVDKRFYETRHPQDFLRSIPDRQDVPNPRTESEDTYVTVNQVSRDDL